MKGRLLLDCLPSIRWVPSDIPNEGSQRRSRSRGFAKRHMKKGSGTSPTPPIHRRKSTLSITSTPDPELDARTNAQGQSTFFEKLPLELRQMVYELVVGEEVVHLTLGAKGRFGHFLCEEGGLGLGLGWECSCRVLVGGRECRRLDHHLLSFLTTCRRMYSEAIPILYKSHTFSLLHATHLLYLPNRIPIPRINTLRTLRLRWTIRALPYFRRPMSKKYAYPEDTANWQRAWQIIASMNGLRDLYVVLVDSNNIWEQKWLEMEGQLLEPVKLVIQPRWFELWLPYARSGVGWDMGGSSCRLRKPERPDSEEEDEDD
ncbi:hypothetical protein K469DRAFT_575050 [Zopfia rhizophila CBS 207.26]|uniref:DUF7730 domain-containing protein n=1 Tax=Zopfia rhizophila CBS 207.26 TaxID=1314779 RepID=A0A6A6E1N5_9PEZI|nr:hypothetical protein K469DRAFT_575050 [Zopfia rhizophila CBS 207.26]